MCVRLRWLVCLEEEEKEEERVERCEQTTEEGKIKGVFGEDTEKTLRGRDGCVQKGARKERE